MADHDDDRERTESPTQKRLDDARKKGQVPRSRDLGAAAVVLAGGAGLYGLGSAMGGRLLAMMRAAMTFSRASAFDDGRMVSELGHAAGLGLAAAAPILGLLLAAAVLAPLAIGGWAFSGQALAPDFSRLDPIKGFGRMFSMHGVLELLKSLARFLVVGLVAVIVLWKQFGTFSTLGNEPVRVGIAHALSLCGSALIALGGGLAIIALVDVPLALWQHHKSLRMSREEIRDEAKETDGNPELKGRIRRVQNEMARKRMMQDAVHADVVITNPTHYAVALRYDDTRMRAPIVVAKGADLIARRIREIATEHEIAIVEAPPLARALFAHCELGDEIPARLYATVAQVLTYVYQLRTARRDHARPPPPPRVQLPPQVQLPPEPPIA